MAPTITGPAAEVATAVSSGHISDNSRKLMSSGMAVLARCGMSTARLQKQGQAHRSVWVLLVTREQDDSEQEVDESEHEGLEASDSIVARQYFAVLGR